MSVIHNDLLLSTDEATGYNLTKSLRTRASASAYLNRTPASAGNRQKWTWSGWVKRGTLGSYGMIFWTGSGATDTGLYFELNNTLLFNANNTTLRATTQVFRDPAAWYHIVVALDTTQATAANRILLYVNGVQVTAFATNNTPTLNDSYAINNTAAHYIGQYASGGSYFDGYMAETNFVDGQQLTPSSFGETDAITGVWKPKAFAGTYGTNGFYLPFTDVATTSGSNAGLGKDFSGNGNYWTTNNISVTAGATYDSMTDVPTLTSATAANYCVLSPLASSPLISLTNGNLTAGGTDNASLIGTMGVNSGKWYWEVTLSSGSFTPYLGVSRNSYDLSGSGSNYELAGISWYGNGNKKAYTATASTSATANTAGVYGFALDFTAGTLAFYFNNSLVLTDTTIPTSGVTLFPLVVHTNSGANSWYPANCNFGQQPFAYTPPSGFKALNTYNLLDSTIVAGNKVMDATTYTGTGSAMTVTNAAGFKPDLFWIKSRSLSSSNHVLVDSVRGVTKCINSSLTNAESTSSAGTGLTSINSNGFSLGTENTGAGSMNDASGTATYVGWQWQAGQGSSSSNTSGSITSTVSVNASAGFSIATYTGNGSSGATVGHGLGVAPSMVITKCRSNTNTFWQTYHASLGNTKVVYLNISDASATSSASWNNTSPTSTVFSLGNGSDGNGSTFTYVAYCWSEIAGFSKFGSYTGNGSTDGTFVYTGFRPKWVMFKRTDSAAGWLILDSSRNTFNVMNNQLYANASDAESGGATADFLSNGIKIRETGGGTNASGGSYVFMAFAENPFKNSLAR
jgi:hypothetical protein